MPGAQMTLELKRRDVVTGESLALKALVTNTANEPFMLQAGLASCPQYELRSPDDGRVLAVFSQEDYVEGLRMGRQGPPLPERKEEVQPGKSYTMRGDPALYAMAGIPPGRYHLAGRAFAAAQEADTPPAHVESPPVEITIRPARIRRVAAFFCPYGGSEAAVFDHTDPEDGIWLLQKETGSPRVDAGVFYRRDKLAGEGPLEDLALAIKTASGTEGRWVAWVRGGSLGALLGWDNAAAGKAGPAAIELERPRLASPGFQKADGSALFLAVGIQDGAAVVQPCVVSHPKVAKGNIVPLAKDLPARILAHCSQGEDGERIHLVWAERAGDTTRVYARAYGKDGAPLTPKPVELYARDASLQALELAPLPVPGRPGPWAHALFGPQERKDEQGKAEIYFTFVRIPLGGALGDPQEHEVIPPAEPVEAWAVSGLVGGGGVLVLAKTPDSILRTWAGPKTEWQVLAKDVKDVHHLSVVASPGGYWAAVWVDPASGFRFAADPDFGAAR